MQQELKTSKPRIIDFYKILSDFHYSNDQNHPIHSLLKLLQEVVIEANDNLNFKLSDSKSLSNESLAFERFKTYFALDDSDYIIQNFTLWDLIRLIPKLTFHNDFKDKISFYDFMKLQISKLELVNLKNLDTSENRSINLKNG